MHGKQMKAKSGGAHSPTTGKKGPKEGHPDAAQTGSPFGPHTSGPNINPASPAEDKNLYQEGNMSLSAPNPNHRPETAVSQQLPGGTTTSGDTQ